MALDLTGKSFKWLGVCQDKLQPISNVTKLTFFGGGWQGNWTRYPVRILCLPGDHAPFQPASYSIQVEAAAAFLPCAFFVSSDCPMELLLDSFAKS